MLPSYSNLTNLRRYLNKYPDDAQPAAFEYLVATAFSQIFYLPFQTKDTEDDTVNHRVIWHGIINKKSKTISKSPSGPDSICFAYGFYVLNESTLLQNSLQWRKEFVQSINHYDDFLRDRNADRKDTYLAFVFPELHKDTYKCFLPKAKEGYNIMLLESSTLAKIGHTAKIVPTVRCLDLRQLFKNMVEEYRESISFDKFKDDLKKTISGWEEKVFKREKTVFWGLRSYEAIKKVGKNTVGTSDILLKLNRDRIFNYYIKILGGGDLTSYIKEGLLSERLACLVKAPDEDFFSKVNSADFKGRGLRLINAVEEIDG